MILVNTLILLASPLFTLFLFSYVFGQRRRNRLNSAFLFFIGISFIEALSDFSFRVLDEGILRQVFLSITTSLFFVSVFAFLNFIYALIDKKRDLIHRIFFILAIACAILPLVNTSLHSAQTFNPPQIYTPLPNALFTAIFIIFAIPATIYGIYLSLHRAISSSDAAERRRLFIWNSSIALAFFYVFLICFILPDLFHITLFSSFSSLSLIITDIFTYWLVRRHNFMTVNITQLEEILEKVFSGANEAILLIDRKQTIVRANNAAMQMFNSAVNALPGQSIVKLIPALEKNHANDTFESTITVSDEQRTVLVSVTSLNAADETVHSVIIVRDITKMKDAEKESFRKQQLESLGLLAGGIAHDFNNLLCGIVSSFSLAGMNVDVNSETGKLLAEGEKAALSARGLTQQLLAFAKGSASVASVLNPLDVIRDACTFSVRGKDTRLEFDFPSVNIRIEADEGQLRQVFQNLVINACQAMPDGGLISVKCKCVSIKEKELFKLSADEYLETVVSDQGTGIPPEVLPKIFDPYFSTKQGGNGIGLAIVYRVIAQHHGHITVMSEVGKGTVFTIYLPITSHESGAQSAAGPKAQTASGNILIMDDDVVIRHTLSALLQKMGYTVDAAKNGEEALEKFNNASVSGKKYKLMITDLTVIGGMGGLKLSQEVLLRDPAFPVIISSGYSDDLDIESFKSLGITAFLKKPYSHTELRAVLEMAG